MLRAYKKYSRVGAVAPPNLVLAAAAAAQTGSVEAIPEQYDSSYLTPVQIGEKTLNLDFDTGSADLWVFSSFLPPSKQAGHDVYTPSRWAEQLDGCSWNITYGDQSGASGTVYTDRVVVGAVTATSQAVEAATSISIQFDQDTNNDGVLGLAFSSINTVEPEQQTTFFGSVKGSLAKAVFTVDLKVGQAGTYDFGYIDPSKYTGDIVYTPVDAQRGFWEFQAGRYFVGSSNVTSGTIGLVLVDTGTTLIYVEPSVAAAYYRQVYGAWLSDSQGGYIFPCLTVLPNFNVVIGNQTFVVPGEYLNYAPIDNTGSSCFGGLQPNDGIGLTIFGDIFFKAVFVVFDQSQDSAQLGFAAQHQTASRYGRRGRIEE